MAAFEGRCAHCEMQVTDDDDLMMLDNSGATVLHAATAGGSWEIVDLLLQKGCDIEAVTRQGCTVLHYAAFGTTSSHDLATRRSTEILVLARGCWVVSGNLAPTLLVFALLSVSAGRISRCALHTIQEHPAQARLIRSLALPDYLLEYFSQLCPAIMSLQTASSLMHIRVLADIIQENATP